MTIQFWFMIIGLIISTICTINKIRGASLVIAFWAVELIYNLIFWLLPSFAMNFTTTLFIAEQVIVAVLLSFWIILLLKER